MGAVQQELVHFVDTNPEPQKSGTIELHITFVRPIDIEPIADRSSFSCVVPAKEFIEDVEHKRDLYNFWTETVDEYDAIILIRQLIQRAAHITASLEYCSRYALSMWSTFEIFRLSQEPVLGDPELEEVIQATLAEDTLSKLRPASKLGVKSLSKRRYLREPKSSKCIADRCTICLNNFTTGKTIGTLPCGHEFHNKCIVEWLNISHVCPLCRYELPCEGGITPKGPA